MSIVELRIMNNEVRTICHSEFISESRSRNKFGMTANSWQSTSLS